MPADRNPLVPSCSFAVEVYPHGIGIRGEFPVDLLEGIDAMAKARKYDLIDEGSASVLGLVFFLTDKAGMEATRAAIAKRNVDKAPLDAWLAGYDTGLSSMTIVFALTGRGHLGAFGPSVPLDGADFGRCHRLLEAVPELRERLPEVAEKYPVWASLVAAWDELTALYLKELPTGRCPRLNARIRELEATDAR